MMVTARAHFCDIDARVLSGMQVTVQAHVCLLTVGCKGGMQLRWWLGTLFGVLVDFRKIDGRLSWGVLFGVLFRVMVRAHYCSIDGRVLLGAFFGGVLLEVLVCKHCYLGSYAGVFFFYPDSQITLKQETMPNRK